MVIIKSKQNVIKNTYNLVNYLLKTIPLFINRDIKINHRENVLTLPVSRENLLNIVKFLKGNQLLQFKTLISITAVDYPKNKERFEVNYFLLSYKLNKRIILKVNTDDVTPLPSLTSIYKGAN
jgi:NADH:ubiquinone oxidoreductase subunit C